jgi:acetyl esterase/lipase
MNARAWAGLGLIMAGGLGLAAVRFATRRGSVAMLDATDRVFAGGDRAIRLACSAQYGPDPAQCLQVFVPADAANDAANDAGQTGRALPVIAFIHGGGWASGTPHDYRFIARMLAPQGYAVVLTGYRLHPDACYPAMLEDGAAALGWIAAHAGEWGGDARRVVVMGHSAGAYNAAMLGLDRRWRQAGVPLPCGIVGLAGPYDFLPLDDHTTIATFGHVANLRETQPITHVHGTAPPLLLIHGADDRRVRPRHSLALARALASCGARSETHVLPGIGHEGLIMRFARPFARDRRALAHVLDFLAQVTHLHSTELDSTELHSPELLSTGPAPEGSTAARASAPVHAPQR